MVLCIAGFVAMYLIQSEEYRKSEAEYDSLRGYASEKPVEKSMAEKLKEAGIPEFSVDFEALSSVNSDLVGWIYMPGLDISYPVVQGEDDEVYLHRTFEGETNSSGCIFMESLTEDLDRYNSFLFGHNMKNGTMFGSLKRLVQEEGLYRDCPEFYFYTPGDSRRYVVYSYYITSPESDTYYLNENDEEYGDWQNRVLGYSSADCGVEVDPQKPTLTLSTCSGTGANKQRLVVHGLLESRVESES